MLTNENSQRNKGREKVAEVGRKRKPGNEGADVILGFKVAPALVKALDAESDAMTEERGINASQVSRTETIKILLGEALEARAKARAERSKPRQ
jgi:hypothetical protein